MLSISLMIVASLTLYSQKSEVYIDLIASHPQNLDPHNLSTAPRDGTIHVSKYDTYLELRNEVEATVTESRDYDWNTDIGLTNMEVGRMIVIHPNPVVDRFRLKVPAEVGEVISAGIYDMGGSRVRSFGSKIGNRKDKELEMDATDLVPGLYFLRIENNAGTITRSFEVRDPEIQ